jgi:predicted phage terminase large subunit-like protein
MMNIKTELETNILLKKDLGPFNEDSDEWGSYSIVFKKNNARITVASTEQSIRGIRHNEHRPDLIICDDVEDVQSAKTREGREKTYNWLKSEVIPTGDRSTRLIVVGNLLHEDSLLMRLKSDIDASKSKGIFKRYPLLDENENCLWTGKYPTKEDIEEEKQKIASEVSWQREYLLRIIPTDDQVIYPEWIKFYDDLPPVTHKAYRGTYAGVDLAISASDSADFTSVVMARIYGRRDKLRIYILPNPINKKLNFPAQVELLKNIKNTEMPKSTDKLFVESVAYQEALPQMLQMQGIKAEAIKPKGDKRTRLALTSTSIKSGIIKFPRHGCEELLEQMIGFGVEKHDDLADAFSLLVNTALDKHSGEGTIVMAFWGPGCDDEDSVVRYSDYILVD